MAACLTVLNLTSARSCVYRCKDVPARYFNPLLYPKQKCSTAAHPACCWCFPHCFHLSDQKLRCEPVLAGKKGSWICCLVGVKLEGWCRVIDTYHCTCEVVHLRTGHSAWPPCAVRQRAYFSERTHFTRSKYYVFSPDVYSLGTRLLLLPYWVANSGLSELVAWNSDFRGHFSWWIRLGTQTSDGTHNYNYSHTHTKVTQLYEKPPELHHGVLNNYSKWLSVSWGKTFFSHWFCYYLLFTCLLVHNIWDVGFYDISW